MQCHPSQGKKGTTEPFPSHHQTPDPFILPFEILRVKNQRITNCNVKRRKQARVHVKAWKSLTEFTLFVIILIKRHLLDSFLFDSHHLHNVWTALVRHTQGIN